MKKTRLVLLSVIFLSAAIFFRVFAQDVIKDFEKQVRQQDINPPKFTHETMLNTVLTVGAFVNGTTDGSQAGAITGVSNGIAALSTTPVASTEMYLADLRESMGIPTAYAQGTGYVGLQPIVHVWKVFRNIAYIFFVLVFLAVGFMIMFRFRIDPRTVVTIQNSLPRLILALLLVTFSFAIAGLLIDVMYVVSFLFFNIFEQATGLSEIASTFRTDYQSATPFNFWWGGTGIGPTNPANAVYEITNGIFAGGIGGWVAGRIIQGIAWFVIGVALLFVMFRLFFTLLMAYIWIILGVIFGPFWIMLGGLPLNLGAVGFGGWLRHMAGNLAAFPTTAGMFLLGSAFMNQEIFRGSEGSGQAWIAPLIGAGYDHRAIMSLIGIGFIFLTPAVVRMTRDAFHAPEFKYGSVIGQQVESGRRVAAAPITVPFGLLQQGFGLTAGPWVIRRIARMFGAQGEQVQAQDRTPTRDTPQ